MLDFGKFTEYLSSLLVALAFVRKLVSCESRSVLLQLVSYDFDELRSTAAVLGVLSLYSLVVPPPKVGTTTGCCGLSSTTSESEPVSRPSLLSLNDLLILTKDFSFFDNERFGKLGAGLLSSDPSEFALLKFLDKRFLVGLLFILDDAIGVVAAGGGMGFARVCLRVLSGVFFFFLTLARVSSSVSSLLYL